jgi:hypothetical protein
MVTIYRIGHILARIPTAAKQMRIKMRNEHHYVAFYICEDGAPYRKLNYVQNVESMNGAAYDGFSSLRAGLFSMGMELQNSVRSGMKPTTLYERSLRKGFYRNSDGCERRTGWIRIFKIGYRKSY